MFYKCYIQKNIFFSRSAAPRKPHKGLCPLDPNSPSDGQDFHKGTHALVILNTFIVMIVKINASLPCQGIP